jgi:hypothetical protein
VEVPPGAFSASLHSWGALVLLPQYNSSTQADFSPRLDVPPVRNKNVSQIPPETSFLRTISFFFFSGD